VLLAALTAGSIFLIDFSLAHKGYNVILVTVDTLRADHLSCYNREAAPTPEIDSIARDGVMFRHAYTVMPVTVPAHGSILTSRPPHELKLFDNGYIYRQGFPLLSELLMKEGYATAAFISLGVLKKEFGLARGFQIYEDDLPRGSYKTAPEVNAAVFPWLERVCRGRFFAWIHYSDPHGPYLASNRRPDTQVLVHGVAADRVELGDERLHELRVPLDPGRTSVEFSPIGDSNQGNTRYLRKLVCRPSSVGVEYGDGFRKETLHKAGNRYRFDSHAVVILDNPSAGQLDVQILYSGSAGQTPETAIRNYAAEVHRVDAQIGALRDKIRQLGLDGGTVLILTADHGEGLGDHGNMGHGYPLYNELLSVPLLISYPYLSRKGLQVDDVVDHLDIMPTVVSLLHVKDSPPMRGRSLASYLSWSPSSRFPADRRKRALVFAATPDAVAPSFAVQDGRFKLIQTKRRDGWAYHAYDLSKDPQERNNLLRKTSRLLDGERFAEWKTLLMRIAAESEMAGRGLRKDVLTPEDREMLQELGYAGED
jgi:arylsulfatase A-like enzyme